MQMRCHLGLLISCDFLKLAVPFLVTLLNGAVKLHNFHKKEAYELLVKVLKNLNQTRQSNHLKSGF